MAKLYLAGVGPGGAGLVTLAAKRAAETADVVAYPVREHGEKSAALDIISGAADIKETCELVFPMSAPEAERKRARHAAAEKLAALLSRNKTVCMVTLGDVSVYSTCGYVRGFVESAGFETETIPGITSFSAAAAAAGVNLCEGNESVAVVSGVRGAAELERLVDGFDTVVVMKAARSMGIIYETLKKRGLLETSFAARSVGMDGGGIFPVSPNESGYFTTVIIKK